MKLFRWQTIRKLRGLLQEIEPPPEQMALRLKSVERDIILPVKAIFALLLSYSFFISRWFEDVAIPRSVAQQIIERFFLIYLTFNVFAAAALIFSKRLPSALVQRVIFTSSFVDGLFLAALAFVTGGFDSLLYWVFLGLIVRNALSSPLAVPQIILNFSIILCYVAAGILDVIITDEMLDFEEISRNIPENPAEPFILRVFVLFLMAACCYGVQVLFEKQRRAEEEAREFTSRQEQLHSAGRLAAQIAHQIKNPLAIINNAAFTLQRSLRGAQNGSQQQLEIIREEVERSDRIITKLMGYAQLAEGKVEKLKVTEEIDRAVLEVFPPAAKYDAHLEKDYSLQLPYLLMQRGHLSEILVNILQNAREATGGKGPIKITAASGADHSVVVTISDQGPGIQREQQEKVFQAYFSTKQKGTGLGLAIARHNAEIYGGTVKVESDLGKGAKFIIHLPTRTFMKLQT